MGTGKKMLTLTGGVLLTLVAGYGVWEVSDDHTVSDGTAPPAEGQTGLQQDREASKNYCMNFVLMGMLIDLTVIGLLMTLTGLGMVSGSVIGLAGSGTKSKAGPRTFRLLALLIFTAIPIGLIVGCVQFVKSEVGDNPSILDILAFIFMMVLGILVLILMMAIGAIPLLIIGGILFTMFGAGAVVLGD